MAVLGCIPPRLSASEQSSEARINISTPVLGWMPPVIWRPPHRPAQPLNNLPPARPPAIPELLQPGYCPVAGLGVRANPRFCKATPATWDLFHPASEPQGPPAYPAETNQPMIRTLFCGHRLCVGATCTQYCQFYAERFLTEPTIHSSREHSEPRHRIKA